MTSLLSQLGAWGLSPILRGAGPLRLMYVSASDVIHVALNLSRL
jgi:hypothetical protein